MRFKNSIFKFVKALTCVQLLEVSNKEAVDKAFHLLSRKLEFIKKIEPELAVPRYRTTKADKLALILKNPTSGSRSRLKLRMTNTNGKGHHKAQSRNASSAIGFK